MRTRLRSKATLLFMTLGMLLAIPAVALADNIVNTLDPTVDAVAENMPLVAGGASGTTKLYVDPTNGDGKNGCNLTGSTTLVVAVNSNNTSVATVSPSQVTFTSCVNSANGIPITVTPHSQGTATITVSQVSNNTGATFNFAPATFTVTVAPPPNTPPQISVQGVTGGASYNKGSVPAATCQVTDAEDGNSSFPATLSAITGPYASDGIGSQTATCSYTDAGGATATASLSYSIVDPSAPVITKTVTGTLGNNGWYTDDVTVTWNVSDPQSANSLSSTGCGPTTISSDTTGQTLTCSATSAGGTSTDSVTIKRDATAPTVLADADRGADHNGWYNHALTVSFSGTDATSGIASCDPDVNYSGPEGTGKTVSGSCTDEAGNSASDTFGPFNYDATAPTVQATPDRAADHNGWYNHAFTVSFSGTDTTNGSGNVSCDPDVNYSGPATNSDSISGSCADEAGNSASDTFNFKYDATAPTISGVRSPGPNGFGWNNTSVAVNFTCNDNLSGVVSCGPNANLPNEGANQSATGSATDDAGNTASTTVSPINIDLTKPNVSLVGGPVNGGSYYFGFVPNAPTCSASDLLSGLDGACLVSGYGTTVGPHTVTATAKDKAANTNAASNAYTVLGWDFRGFYQPVDMLDSYGDPVLNTVKGGSTVPFKFELFAGTTELTETSRVVQPLKATKVACDTGATLDEIELTATGGTGLRYDTTGGQYIYNWQTPKQAGACYSVTISAQDGSSKTAHFRLK